MAVNVYYCVYDMMYICIMHVRVHDCVGGRSYRPQDFSQTQVSANGSVGSITATLLCWYIHWISNTVVPYHPHTMYAVHIHVHVYICALYG